MIARIHTFPATLPSYTENVSKILAIPVGGCGCGKSTTLATMFPGASIADADQHKQRHPLYTADNPGGPDDIVHNWSKEQALTEVFEFLANGVDRVIYDTTGGTVARIAAVAETARAMGYRVVIVRMWTPRETAWGRNVKRTRTVPRIAFDRTHTKVAKVWGRVRMLADEIVNVCMVGVHEAR